MSPATMNISQYDKREPAPAAVGEPDAGGEDTGFPCSAFNHVPRTLSVETPLGERDWFWNMNTENSVNFS
jgi:hypothetical protein